MVRLALSTYSYAPAIGGVERHTQQLSRALVARGHRVHIVTAQQLGAPASEVDEHGVVITRVDAGTGNRWRRMATYVAAASGVLVRLRADFDVLHVQQALYPAAALTVLARALRKPVVVRNSGSGEHGAVQLMSRLPFGRSALAVIGHGAATVSLSREMTAEMRQAGFRDVTEIHNGVAAARAMDRAVARRELGLPEAARIVLAVGRLDREKGTAMLASAWGRVASPSAVLVICGDGPDRGHLEGLPRVHLAGAVRDVAPYYAAADVFVLPSESEGISNALLEAMAAGLPPIVTAVGGNREVVTSEAIGMVTEPRSSDALARAIEELLAAPATCAALGRSAQAHVTRNWSAEAMVDAYERLYDRLLG